MESSTRFSSSLGKRSIFARIAAVLALAGCLLALYLVYQSFVSDEDAGGKANDKKGRSEQAHKQDPASKATTYTVVAGDTLSGIAEKTGVPEARLGRLNPDIDAETLNAGQVLKLR